MLAHDPPTRTVLFDDVPGQDQNDPDPSLQTLMVGRLVDLQSRWSRRVEPLLAARLADWRGVALVRQARELVRRDDVRARLGTDDRAALAHFVWIDLPDRLADLTVCGLPDTLLHGDPQPLNWRVGAHGLRLLDWGEAGVGSPGLDRGPLVDAATSAQRRHRPSSDPDRTAALGGPVACLRAALVYQGFLDGIEPSEHVYHADDVPRQLRNLLASLPGTR